MTDPRGGAGTEYNVAVTDCLVGKQERGKAEGGSSFLIPSPKPGSTKSVRAGDIAEGKDLLPPI